MDLLQNFLRLQSLKMEAKSLILIKMQKKIINKINQIRKNKNKIVKTKTKTSKKKLNMIIF